MEKSSQRARKKEVPTAYHYPSKYNINNHKIVLFYKTRKKYNEIQLTKNKMDFNIRKMIKHPPSSGHRSNTEVSTNIRLTDLKIQIL